MYGGGMSEETLSAFAKIAEYVCSGKVTKLDLSGLRGLTGLTNTLSSSVGACHYNCSFFDSNLKCNLKTFIGSPDIVALVGAFYRCSQLTSVSGLENVKILERDVFNFCWELTTPPNMPKVTSFGTNFSSSGIQTFCYKNVTTLDFGELHYPYLEIINCPSANSLSGIWRMPKLCELHLTSETFETIASQSEIDWVFADFKSVGQQLPVLYLNENQKFNIGDEASGYQWNPKNAKGETPAGYSYPWKLKDFPAVYCGAEKVLPKDSTE